MQEEGIPPVELDRFLGRGFMGQTHIHAFEFSEIRSGFDDDGKKDIWNSDADAWRPLPTICTSKGWNARPDGDKNKNCRIG